MKKKGFTLIELLAVIVILAIIAVITVPKIADMITSSRKGGAEDSFYGTLKAAELGYTKALQSNTNLKGSICTIEDSKITCTNGVKIDVSGKTPESGTLVIDSAGDVIASKLIMNGYKCYGGLSVADPCVKDDVKVGLDYLLGNVVITGQGLYKDQYGDSSYVYKGANPNNYISFNNELWRIIRIESDNTIKIMKESNVGSQAWDISSNDWSRPATINTFLNNDFYSLLSDVSKKQIEKHDFKIGGVLYKKDQTIEKDIEQLEAEKWNGNVGLPDILDYVKASLNSACTNFYAAATEPMPCKQDNYLYKSSTEWWTMTKNNDNNKTNTVWNVSSSGNVYSFQGVTYATPAIYPVLYLKANIELTGTGTQSDPYKIK